MRLKPKDTLGLALVACAVGLLVLHGRAPHPPPESPAGADGAEAASRGLAHAEEAIPQVVAFIDVRLPGTAGDPAQPATVLVRRGTVDAIGSTGSLPLPVDAVVVDGGGSGYLVARSGDSGGTAWSPVVEGTRGDLVLFAQDPGSDTAGTTLVGRLLEGRWVPAERVAPPPAGD